MLAVIIMFTACHSEGNPEFSSTAPISSTNPSEISLPVYVPGSVSLNPGYNDRSFRWIYYQLPGVLTAWIKQSSEDMIKAYYELMDDFEANTSNEEIHEMIMVTFIKRLNIPKSQFIEIFEEKRAFWEETGLDMGSEQYEIPNADIIYTFDNDIINEYYRRE